jgi:hypothetical protein
MLCDQLQQQQQQLLLLLLLFSFPPSTPHTFLTPPQPITCPATFTQRFCMMQI